MELKCFWPVELSFLMSLSYDALTFWPAQDTSTFLLCVAALLFRVYTVYKIQYFTATPGGRRGRDGRLP